MFDSFQLDLIAENARLWPRQGLIHILHAAVPLY